MKVVYEPSQKCSQREGACFLLPFPFTVGRNVDIMARASILNHKGEAADGGCEGS